MIVDDESALLRALSRILVELHYEVETFDRPGDALDRVKAGGAFDVALLDIRMPGMTGIDLLQHLKHVSPDLEVVMMTAHGTVQDAFQAVRLGAFNFLKKPFENAMEELGLVLGQALERRRLRDRNRFLEQQVGVQDRFEDIVGTSAAMRPVFELIELAAPSQSSILILGETGVGKELVARAIHRRSRRANKPLITVNCAAINASVAEAELFGAEKGGFTDARNRHGLLGAADTGTIFLDEIGELSRDMQSKLLRVLEGGEIRAVGSDENRIVDVRVIAATNVDLDKAVEKGEFRSDLLSRLNVIAIKVPPLRERPEDIPLIAHFFLKRFAEREKKDIRGMAPEVAQALKRYDWPANVRKLRNLIEAAVVMCRGEELTLADFRLSDVYDKLVPPPPLPVALGGKAPGGQFEPSLFNLPFGEAKERAVVSFERTYAQHALDSSEQNLTRAAQLAGMDRTNFRRVLKRCGIRPGGKDEEVDEEELSSKPTKGRAPSES